MAKKVKNKQALVRLISLTDNDKLDVIVDKSPALMEDTKPGQPAEYIEQTHQIVLGVVEQGAEKVLCSYDPSFVIEFWKTYGGELILTDDTYNDDIKPLIDAIEDVEEALELEGLMEDIEITITETEVEEQDEEENKENEIEEEPTAKDKDKTKAKKGETSEDGEKEEKKEIDTSTIMEGDKITLIDKVTKVEDEIIYLKNGGQIDTKDVYQVGSILQVKDGDVKKDKEKKDNIMNSFLEHLKGLSEEEQAIIKEETGIEF